MSSQEQWARFDRMLADGARHPWGWAWPLYGFWLVLGTALFTGATFAGIMLYFLAMLHRFFNPYDAWSDCLVGAASPAADAGAVFGIFGLLAGGSGMAWRVFRKRLARRL